MPEPWGGPVTGNPCANPSGKKLLRMVAKGADVLDEVNQAFSHPLIDQNENYVFAEVRFNQTYYDFVRDNGYYLKVNLPGSSGDPMMMPASAEPDTIGVSISEQEWAT